MKSIRTPLIVFLLALLVTAGYLVTKNPGLSQAEHEILLQNQRAASALADMKRAYSRFYLRNIHSFTDGLEGMDLMQKFTQNADTIRRHSSELTGKLQRLRTQVVNTSSGYIEADIVKSGHQTAVFEKDSVMALLVDLAAYRQTLQLLTESDDFPSFFLLPDGTEASPAAYANFFFVDKPLSIFLMNLAKVEMQIANQELRAIFALGSKSSYLPLNYDDELTPVIIVDDNQPKAGDTFRARVYFASKAVNHNPLVVYEKNALEQENGLSKIAFTPQPPLMNQGNRLLKPWSATGTLSGPYGLRSFTLSDTVFIRK